MDKAKADQGKPRLSLVPINGIYTAIARVREYGVQKYKDPDNWKKVELQRYIDAMLRHVAAMNGDINKRDSESGLPHLWHAAANISFILELQNECDSDIVSIRKDVEEDAIRNTV